VPGEYGLIVIGGGAAGPGTARPRRNERSHAPGLRRSARRGLHVHQVRAVQDAKAGSAGGGDAQAATAPLCLDGLPMVPAWPAHYERHAARFVRTGQPRQGRQPAARPTQLHRVQSGHPRLLPLCPRAARDHPAGFCRSTLKTVPVMRGWLLPATSMTPGRRHQASGHERAYRHQPACTGAPIGWRRGRCRGCLGLLIAGDCRYWRMRI